MQAWVVSRRFPSADPPSFVPKTIEIEVEEIGEKNWRQASVCKGQDVVGSLEGFPARAVVRIMGLRSKAGGVFACKGVAVRSQMPVAKMDQGKLEMP
jgi:hypothetical protein